MVKILIESMVFLQRQKSKDKLNCDLKFFKIFLQIACDNMFKNKI